MSDKKYPREHVTYEDFCTTEMEIPQGILDMIQERIDKFKREHGVDNQKRKR
jgi:predicted nucleic acid-binding protein